jgi:chaperonin cofactor prefoldin
MKRTELLICGLVLVLLTAGAMAQDTVAGGAEPAKPVVAAEAPQTAEAIEAKIKTLKAQEDKDEAQLDAIYSKIAKSPALAELRKAAADADKAYQEKKVSDPGIIAAKKASLAASADLKAAVLKTVKTSADGAAILKQIGDLEEKAADLSVQAAIAELKLKHKDSRVARALGADGVLKELYGIYLSAAKGAPRDAARKNYYKAKQTAMDKLPEAKELAAEIKTCETGIEEIETEIDAAEDKLDKLYDAAADSDDEDIVAAKAKREAARKAYQQVYYGGQMQASRDARSAAKKAMSDKVRALAADDPQAAALKVTLDALGKQIYKLRYQARKLRKKAAE